MQNQATSFTSRKRKRRPFRRLRFRLVKIVVGSCINNTAQVARFERQLSKVDLGCSWILSLVIVTRGESTLHVLHILCCEACARASTIPHGGLGQPTRVRDSLMATS